MNHISALSPSSISPSPQSQKWGIKRFGRDSRGLSTVEYVVLLVIMVVGCSQLWSKIGGHVLDQLTKSDESIQSIGKTTDSQ